MPEPLYAITPIRSARSFGGVRVRVVRAGWFRPDAGGSSDLLGGGFDWPPNPCLGS